MQKFILLWPHYSRLFFLVSINGWVWQVGVVCHLCREIFNCHCFDHPWWWSLYYICFTMNEVVGTVEGGRTPTKIKTDLKKPIVNLACHPRLPVLVIICFTSYLISTFKEDHGAHITARTHASCSVFLVSLILQPNLSQIWSLFLPSQYVAYADGLLRAYNIHTYAVHYTLQSKMIPHMNSYLLIWFMYFF